MPRKAHRVPQPQPEVVPCQMEAEVRGSIRGPDEVQPVPRREGKHQNPERWEQGEGSQVIMSTCLRTCCNRGEMRREGKTRFGTSKIMIGEEPRSMQKCRPDREATGECRGEEEPHIDAENPILGSRLCDQPPRTTKRQQIPPDQPDPPVGSGRGGRTHRDPMQGEDRPWTRGSGPLATTRAHDAAEAHVTTPWTSVTQSNQRSSCKDHGVYHREARSVDKGLTSLGQPEVEARHHDQHDQDDDRPSGKEGHRVHHSDRTPSRTRM